MAYAAMLFKRVEIAANKYKGSVDKSEKQFLAAAKSFEKELRTTRSKINKLSMKNKEFTKLKKVQIKMIDELTKVQSLVVKVIETQDEDLAAELEESLETIEQKVAKHEQEYIKQVNKAIKKHKIKKNAAMNYILSAKNGNKISDKTFTYIVKKGDKINQVAKNYGVSANEIKKLNKLKSSKLNAGQKIKIKVK